MSLHTPNFHMPLSLSATYRCLLQLMYCAVGKLSPLAVTAWGSQPTLMAPGRCQILTWSTDMTPGYVSPSSTLAHALLDMAKFMMRYEGSLGISRCSTVSPSGLVCMYDTIKLTQTQLSADASYKPTRLLYKLTHARSALQPFPF